MSKSDKLRNATRTRVQNRKNRPSVIFLARRWGNLGPPTSPPPPPTNLGEFAKDARNFGGYGWSKFGEVRNYEYAMGRSSGREVSERARDAPRFEPRAVIVGDTEGFSAISWCGGRYAGPNCRVS